MQISPILGPFLALFAKGALSNTHTCFAATKQCQICDSHLKIFVNMEIIGCFPFSHRLIMRNVVAPNLAPNWPEAIKNTNLAGHHPMIISVKFLWNWASSFREQDFWKLPKNTPFGASHDPLRGRGHFIWTNLKALVPIMLVTKFEPNPPSSLREEVI